LPSGMDYQSQADYSRAMLLKEQSNMLDRLNEIEGKRTTAANSIRDTFNNIEKKYNEAKTSKEAIMSFDKWDNGDDINFGVAINFAAYDAWNNAREAKALFVSKIHNKDPQNVVDAFYDFKREFSNAWDSSERRYANRVIDAVMQASGKIADKTPPTTRVDIGKRGHEEEEEEEGEEEEGGGL
jgi:hypothetical protein